jgi:glycosyltransferase involved in cell wall biosynthesis
MTEDPGGSRKPLVSIIIPSFNQAPFLRDALGSTLAQDYRPLEVIVCDGGSTDGTVEILEEFAARHPEVRWWSEPDRGVADAVNKGLARATGSIAGIQSSDDIYLRGAISAAVGHLLDRPELGLVYGDGWFTDETATVITNATSYEPFSFSAFLIGASIILQSSAFFRLDLGRRIGGWRESIFVADTDFWLRMIFETEVLKIDRPLSAWRAHPGQRNDRKKEIWESYWRMIDECEPLRHAPLRVRLSARAGRRVVTQYYNPADSLWFFRLQLWRALLIYPPVFRVIGHKDWLLPAAQPAVRFAARHGWIDDYPKSFVPRPSDDIRWWTENPAS